MRCYAPNISEEELWRLGLRLDMPVVADGLPILGTPVGSVGFVKRFAAELAHEVGSDLYVLARMPPLQLHHCPASGAIQHRTNRLPRNIPGCDLSTFGSLRTRNGEEVLSPAACGVA